MAHTREEPTTGRPVVHWEFRSEAPARAAEFYEKRVFGWPIPALPAMDCRLVEAGGGIDGGIMRPKSGPWPGKLAFHVGVDDPDEYGRRFRQGGGRLLIEKMEVPGVGQPSLFEDPDGRVLGTWKQQRSAT